MKSYLEELKAKKDYFGHPKDSYKTLCPTCFKRLPKDLKNDLYSKMRFGYEEARDAAVTWLEEN